MNRNTFKIVIISVIIVLVGLGIYLFVFNNSKKDENYTHLKKYGANEYISTYVSSEDMAKIYFNDYIHYMRYDLETAYELLDEDYKKEKFSSFGEFKIYARSIVEKNLKLEKFSKTNNNGYSFYKLYFSDDSIIIFKTKGVMQYSVYLDGETIEIR